MCSPHCQIIDVIRPDIPGGSVWLEIFSVRHLNESYLRIKMVNILVLDKSVKLCAQYHCDQRVSKIILEGVQILCTALNKKDEETSYHSTHTKHPCLLSAEASFDNFCWLKTLIVELNAEYRWRYEKDDDHDHATMIVLKAIDHRRFETNGLMPFAQAMPNEYKNANDAVLSYRSFYLNEKSSFATWKKREAPHWWVTTQKDKNGRT
tara:strand:- start:73 stop:693 length:621 start_codon:yes stop_codon:yes gene_type:complete